MRRVHVNGFATFMDYCTGPSYASGGFLADSQFSGSTQATNTDFAVFLSMPLGERDYASVSLERRSNPSETNALLNLSRNLLETDSFGYRVLAGQPVLGRQSAGRSRRSGLLGAVRRRLRGRTSGGAAGSS